MAKRPVRQAAVPCLDDGGHGEPPRQPAGSPSRYAIACSSNRSGWTHEFIPGDGFAAAGLIPRGSRQTDSTPRRSRGKIKFVVARLAVHREECFAAGMAPEPIGAMGLARAGSSRPRGSPSIR